MIRVKLIEPSADKLNGLTWYEEGIPTHQVILEMEYEGSWIPVPIVRDIPYNGISDPFGESVERLE